MMPAPVAVAYTLLIVLPTIKLIAALISRRSWRRMRVLQAELVADPRFASVEDQKLIREAVRDGFGHPAVLLLPLAVPVAMPFAAIVFAVQGWREPTAMDLARQRERHKELRDRLIALQGGAYELPGEPSDELYADSRFRELSELALPVGFLRYPIATLLTSITVILTGWMPMLTLGVHYGGRYVLQNIRDVAQTNTISPLFSTRLIRGI